MHDVSTLRTALSAFLACLLSACASHMPLSDNDSPIVRPVATYSIVARDAETGEMGVAVQSHWFSVGAVVP